MTSRCSLRCWLIRRQNEGFKIWFKSVLILNTRLLSVSFYDLRYPHSSTPVHDPTHLAQTHDPRDYYSNRYNRML